MKNMQKYPYSDDYMRYDEITGHYILTERALIERLGMDLRARMSATSTVNPENVIENFLCTVSDMVYEYVHAFNVDNYRQDCWIAAVPEFRQILQKAMEYQAMYVSHVGNLYLSTDANERENAIDALCKGVLGTVVPRLGVSILYAGVIR